ncbi:MAG: hypothetical protein ACKOAY_12430 [Haliscomenobacter sp.]
MNKKLMFFGMIVICLSCKNEKISWAQSQAICVHWSNYAQSHFRPIAIKYDLYCSHQSFLNNSTFYFIDNKYLNDTIPLKTGGFSKNKNHFTFSLFLESKMLVSHFKKGENVLFDDCYQIELTNMVGQGSLIMKKNQKVIEIQKSPDFHFFVGLR